MFFLTKKLIKAGLLKSIGQSSLYIHGGILLLFAQTILYFLLDLKGQSNLITLHQNTMIPYFNNLNIIFLVICVFSSMGIISQDIKNNKIFWYLSTHLTAFKYLKSKFLIQLSISFFFTLLTLPSLILFKIIGFHDTSILIISMLALMMNQVLYLSIGVFFSSWVKNNVFCALIHFIFCLGLIFSGQFSLQVQNHFMSLWLKNSSLLFHFNNFLQGIIYSYSLVYYFGLSFIFLLLAKIKINTYRPKDHHFIYGPNLKKSTIKNKTSEALLEN